MRIGVDLTPMLPSTANGGAKFAILQFLEALLANHQAEVQLILFVAEITQTELQERFGGRADLYATRRGRCRRFALVEAYRELRSQWLIRRLTRRGHLDVLYSPFGRYLLASTQAPMIALITDLLHRDYPESLSWKDRLWRHLNLKKLAMSGALFQVPSEFTRERLYAAYAVPYVRTIRTYQPIHERFESGHTVGCDPYFFYPARPWIHKNHQKLLRAYRRYREQAGSGAWRLVLTASNDSASSRLKSLAAGLDLAAHIEFLGEISEERLLTCYQSASALVFPSHYEGFGIPLLEAMHFRLPIICGRGGSQMEVAGDAALYVDVEDLDEMAGAMLQVSGNPQLRAHLADAGRQQLARFALGPEVQKLVKAFQRMRQIQAEPVLQTALRHVCFLCFDLVYISMVVLAPVLNAWRQKREVNP